MADKWPQLLLIPSIFAPKSLFQQFKISVYIYAVSRTWDFDVFFKWQKQPQINAHFWYPLGISDKAFKEFTNKLASAFKTLLIC